MIRIPIAEPELRARIRAADPTWERRAKERAAKAASKRRVDDGDGIWSDIKHVFMELQGWKCMYCEKPMPRPDEHGGASGKVEYDVEHFRPKNRVQPWPTERVARSRRIDYAARLRHGAANGYVHLAFDPWNYGVSCKVCNSELKGDRFPILGKPAARTRRRRALDAKEVPCLVLPIGDEGDDPEAWLEWHGPTVRPRAQLEDDDRVRALTLIDFLELDTRQDLLLGRCMAIVVLADWLEAAPDDPAAGDEADKFIAAMVADQAVFAGCLRGFCELYRRDRDQALHWRQQARKYAASKEPALLKELP